MIEPSLKLLIFVDTINVKLTFIAHTILVHPKKSLKMPQS